MALSTLLARPITPILGLCIVLFGVGIAYPRNEARNSVQMYKTPISSVRTVPSSQVTPLSGQTKINSTATPSTTLKHYSVPVRLRGDEGGGFGDD